jgi:flagellar motor switch/type III secretory pathway protein FliN
LTMDTHAKTTLLEEMERLSGIFITVRAELDQTELTFAELLDLDVGSLIQLARPTGENIDIYAEETLIGWAEVLLMDGTLTVRLADLRNARLPGFPEEQVESPAGSSQEE